MILKTVADKLFKIREEAAKARPGADDGFDPHEKPFLDHLEDLRTTLIQMGATLAISTVLCFAFHEQIFRFLQLPPKRTKMSDGGNLWDKLDLITLAPPEILMLMLKVSFFTAVIIAMPLLIFFAFQFILPGLRQIEKKMIIPGAGVGFVLFLIGASFAFFLAAPIALKFFFEFENARIGDLNPAAKAMEQPIAQLPLIGVGGKKIEPLEPVEEKKEETKAKTDGESTEQASAPPEKPKKKKKKDELLDPTPAAKDPLTPEMKQAVRGYMFELLAVQEGKNFVLRYDESRDKIILAHSKGARTTYQIGKYFEFITRLTLVFGLSFQLPVIVTILVKLELLTARVMRATRTYAWIIIMVSAAILTPPDLMTLGLLAGPMIVLYEICVIIASIIERKREKKELAEEEKRRSRMERLYSTPHDDLSEEEKAELHRHEIEQYEKEHAHLYDSDGHEVDEHGHLIGYDPDHDEHGHDTDHDESWHEDHQYYHDGEEEADEPVDDDHDDEDDPHKGEIEHQPIQDWPDKETEPDAESDHAEPTGDEEPEADEEDDKPEPKDPDEDDPNNDCCEPTGPVVDMNHAEIDELMTLSGVDDWLANMIIDHRPYESFEDLEEIVGEDKVMEWMERLMLG